MEKFLVVNQETSTWNEVYETLAELWIQRTTSDEIGPLLDRDYREFSRDIPTLIESVQVRSGQISVENDEEEIITFHGIELSINNDAMIVRGERIHVEISESLGKTWIRIEGKANEIPYGGNFICYEIIKEVKSIGA